MIDKATASGKGRRFGRLTVTMVVFTCVLGSELYAQTTPIYPDAAVAPSEIKAALTKAGLGHKRIIVDFGGNWCGDCKALDSYFHKSPNADLLKRYFVLVDVNIGKMDQNLDIAKKYGVPLDQGVPALAVLDEKGAVLFSQKHGEFEAMRSMDPASVTKFLEQWKGTAASDTK
jgi:thiol-disulfide isomerase/thioredoxin